MPHRTAYLVPALRATYGLTVWKARWRTALIGPVYVSAIVVTSIAIVLLVMPELFGLGGARPH